MSSPVLAAASKEAMAGVAALNANIAGAAATLRDLNAQHIDAADADKEEIATKIADWCGKESRWEEEKVAHFKRLAQVEDDLLREYGMPLLFSPLFSSTFESSPLLCMSKLLSDCLALPHSACLFLAPLFRSFRVNRTLA